MPLNVRLGVLKDSMAWLIAEYEKLNTVSALELPALLSELAGSAASVQREATLQARESFLDTY